MSTSTRQERLVVALETDALGVTERRIARKRDPRFRGRCYLCGEPVNPAALFCAAHRWAGLYL